MISRIEYYIWHPYDQWIMNIYNVWCLYSQQNKDEIYEVQMISRILQYYILGPIDQQNMTIIYMVFNDKWNVKILYMVSG